MPPTRSRSPLNNRNDRWVIFILLYCVKYNMAVQLTGFNCNEVMGVQYKPSLCSIDHESIIQSNMSVSIVIDTDRHIEHSIRCHILVKQDSWYCGSYSHLHLLNIPTEFKIVLTGSDCKKAYVNSQITLFDRNFDIKLNQSNTFSTLINGSVNLGLSWQNAENVFCKPLGVFVGDTFVPDGFLAVVINVEVEMVTVMVNKDYIIDLSRGIIIGSTNDCTTTCYENSYSYFMLKPFTTHRLLKTLNIREIKINQVSYIQSLEYNFMLRLTGYSSAIRNGHTVSFMAKTDIENILISKDSNMQFKTLHHGESDWNFNNLVFTMGQVHELNQKLKEHEQFIQCQHRINNQIFIREKFIPGFKIVQFGELIKIEQCKEISVEIHQDIGFCYLDHLRVMYQGIIYGLQVETRSLEKLDNLTLVDCKSFPAFLWLYDNIYVTNNEKGTVILNISDPQNPVKFKEIFRDNDMEDLYEYQIKQDEPIDISSLQASPSILDGVVHTIANVQKNLWDWTPMDFIYWIKRVIVVIVILILSIVMILVFVYGLYRVINFLLNVRCWSVHGGHEEIELH